MMRFSWWCRAGCLAAVGAGVLAVAVRANPWSERYPSASGGSAVGEPIPNVLLPKDVPAPEGKLTLYADFARRTEGGVPLYLVNRTGKPVTLGAEDGSICLRLEHRLRDGSWERAQAYVGSACGNSYMGVTLGPGQHFAFSGYMPGAGEKARVRFSGYDGLEMVSNTGEGFVLARDIADARRDFLGRSVSWRIERPLDVDQSGGIGPPQSPEIAVVALRMLQAAGSNPYYQDAAARLAESWEKNPKATTAEKAGAKAMREILAGPWAEERNFDGLLARCLQALRSPGAHAGEFGRVEGQPVLVWEVLDDLAGSGVIQDPRKWKPVLDFALANPTEGSIRDAAWVVAVPRIADELLPDIFFEKHLFDDDESVQRVCATALSRRAEWEQLAQLGWRLPPRGQIIVLQALAAVPGQTMQELGTPREPRSDGEEAFWTHCLETQTAEACEVLRMLGNPTDDPAKESPYSRIMHKPLRDLLVQKAASQSGKEEKLDQKGASISRLVDLLASCNREEDDAFFTSLLKLGGYSEGEVSTSDGKRVTRRTYDIRDAAKRVLLKRGKPVPADLVVQKDFPL